MSFFLYLSDNFFLGKFFFQSRQIIRVYFKIKVISVEIKEILSDLFEGNIPACTVRGILGKGVRIKIHKIQIDIILRQGSGHIIIGQTLCACSIRVGKYCHSNCSHSGDGIYRYPSNEELKGKSIGGSVIYYGVFTALCALPHSFEGIISHPGLNILIGNYPFILTVWKILSYKIPVALITPDKSGFLIIKTIHHHREGIKIFIEIFVIIS